MIYGNDWIEKFQFEISAEKINKLIEACNSMPINESTILLEKEINIDASLKKGGFKFKKSFNSEGKKVADQIAKIVKSEGLTKISKSKISKLVEDYHTNMLESIDSISLSEIMNNPKLKNSPQEKVLKAVAVLVWCLMVSYLAVFVLTSLFGPFGNTITIVLVGPVIEESCKKMAAKGGFSDEFNVVFNVFEFTGYFMMNRSIANALVRLTVVGMHSVTSALHKLGRSEEAQKFFKCETEDEKKNLANIADTAGTLIHVIWNSVAMALLVKDIKKAYTNLFGHELGEFEAKQHIKANYGL